MSMQEVFHWPGKPLEKTREIENESEAHNSVRHLAKLSNVLGPKHTQNALKVF